MESGRRRTRSSVPTTGISRSETTGIPRPCRSLAALRWWWPSHWRAGWTRIRCWTPSKPADGKTFTLQPPQPAPEIPENGFVFSREGYTTPPARKIGRAVDGGGSPPESKRLQLLEPFPAWDGEGCRERTAAPEGQGQVHDGPHLDGGSRGCAFADTSTTSVTISSREPSTPSPRRRGNRARPDFRREGGRLLRKWRSLHIHAEGKAMGSGGRRELRRRQ